MNTSPYTIQLRKHYENYFGSIGQPLNLTAGPVEKLHPDFYVLEFAPGPRHKFWVYCTVGMALQQAENQMELFVFSPRQDILQVELLTVCASFHRNIAPLGLNHTVNIGRPWLDNSLCDHAFISLPYIDGDELGIFSFENTVLPCYWLIPITLKERDYKIEEGAEALEQRFEAGPLDYLNPNRSCLVSIIP